MLSKLLWNAIVPLAVGILVALFSYWLNH
ncbi:MULTISPECIES: type I toxin-antitoxin system Fst family toxin [Selenomonas]|uniref:Type I toxin-antitoxin system Fst family toxin n=1 Tax=Selenomonas ruminantium TaxID=971 RepID=A0A927WJY4_SELRU|nr:type I toxin-antitoxin system Fst family toxin [Selenomonas ruminantium]